MTAAELYPLAELAWARYGLSAEARAQAWESCLVYTDEGGEYVCGQAARCYASIAASLRPME